MLSSRVIAETYRLKLMLSMEQKTIMDELYKTYSQIVRECLDEAVKKNINSLRRLYQRLYKKLAAKYPSTPSRYIIAAMMLGLRYYDYHKHSIKKGRAWLPRIKQPLMPLERLRLGEGVIELATYSGKITIPFEVDENLRRREDWIMRDPKIVKGDDGEYYICVRFEKIVGEGEGGGG